MGNEAEVGKNGSPKRFAVRVDPQDARILYLVAPPVFDAEVLVAGFADLEQFIRQHPGDYVVVYDGTQMLGTGIRAVMRAKVAECIESISDLGVLASSIVAHKPLLRGFAVAVLWLLNKSNIKLHASVEEGRAYCVSMLPNAQAQKKR